MDLKSYRKLWVLAVILATGASLVWVGKWTLYRFTHSVTRDAFVDSHLINLAPQVPGAIVEMLAQEQDGVSKGQLLAVVDPATYGHKVELESARLAVVEETLKKARVDLKLLEETVPKKIIIARQKNFMAIEGEKKAADALKMITEDVEESINAAGHALEGARARLAMASEDYQRYDALSRAKSATTRRFEEATRAYRVAQAEVKVAQADLGKAQARRNQIGIARQDLESSRHAVAEAEQLLSLAELGELEIEAAKRRVSELTRSVGEADQALQLAQVNLDYTRVVAPCNGTIAKKWRHLGDYAHTGEPIFSMYNPELMYVTVNLEETLLEGVNPGNRVRLDVDAFDEPFYGRVLWIGSATDAKFSLIPRDVSSGEFTYIVQRVPVRIWIEREQRRLLLKPGLSVTAAIEHGPGDPQWAAKALLQEKEIEELGSRAP